MRNKILCSAYVAISLLFPLPMANASSLTQNFNFDGYLLDSSDNPITTSSTIVFDIYDSAIDCLLYRETHSGITPAADGGFSLKVGAGTRAGAGVDGGVPWTNIFENGVIIRAPATPNCATGYTSAAGDGRKLRVTVNGTLLSPDYSMSAVPMATMAESLQGKTPTDFVQTSGNAILTGPMTLANENELRFSDNDGSNTVSIKAPSVVPSDYILSLPDNAGAAGDVLSTDGAGNLSWVVAGGASISSLNGLATSSQSFANGTAGTAPAWSSVGSTHTLNIPYASTASASAGLLSNADYSNFMSKQPALGYVPLNKAGDNMTGALVMSSGATLILAVAPTSGMEAATKNYVDAAMSSGLPTTGGTMTGALILAANPSATMEAATKQYVDNGLSGKLSLSGGVMTGVLTVSSGSVNMPAGSASVPSVQINGMNGLFSPGAGMIGVATGSVERIRVMSSGNVGIGIAAPSAMLDVNGTAKLGTSGTPMQSIQNFNNVTCTMVPSTISGGQTGNCVASIGGTYNPAQNLSVSCHPYSAFASPAIHSCFVSAANTVMIVVQNASGTPLTPPGGWNITITKF